MSSLSLLQKLCQLVRYDILTSTTAAGSGHPTSSLSAVELAVTLFFGGFLRYDLKNPDNPANDRFILSKGHASPLLYSLYHAAGAISYNELMTLRKFGSTLEGHPTPRFKFVDVATGSLGQGLSVGVGMAMGMRNNFKIQMTNDKSVPRSMFQVPRVWVLLGDSEMAEGQVWEAMEIASYYKLNNLIGIIDVNRLGQRGETMLGWDIKTYAKRCEAFGWKTVVIDDGNNLQKVYEGLTKALPLTSQVRVPVMVIAKTVKGKSISFLENKNGWHGKAVPKERLQEALKELGQVDLNVRGKIKTPNFKFQITNDKSISNKKNYKLPTTNYKLGSLVATREAYGDALVALGEINPSIVVLDAEVSNSTYAEKFAQKFPNRYFEMFIAEQNMVSTALGLSKIGYIPFASSFAAFLTRAFDQIRMAQYSANNNFSDDRIQSRNSPNIKLVGSHPGVSIGSDGPSQMGLEDLAMMRSILNSTIFYPCDAVSSFQLTHLMAENEGFFYLRTTREKTPVIYKPNEEFKIGGSKILRQSQKDLAVVFAAGITLHEALKAYERLKNEQISLCVVDLYSVKPIDEKTILSLAKKVKNIIVVEDHYPFGGIGEAVLSSITNYELRITKFIHLAIDKLPRSGSPAELLHFEEIDANAIIQEVKRRLI